MFSWTFKKRFVSDCLSHLTEPPLPPTPFWCVCCSEVWWVVFWDFLALFPSPYFHVDLLFPLSLLSLSCLAEISLPAVSLVWALCLESSQELQVSPAPGITAGLACTHQVLERTKYFPIWAAISNSPTALPVNTYWLLGILLFSDCSDALWLLSAFFNRYW